MKKSLLHKTNRNGQFLISIAMVCFVATLGYFLQGFIGYRVVAFMLLVTVSILAMFLLKVT